MSNCFVYGTLMAEEVLKCLIKRVPEQRPGTRALIKGGEKEGKKKHSAKKTSKCPQRSLSPHTLDPRPSTLNSNSSNHRLPQARSEKAGLPGDGARDQDRLCSRQGENKKNESGKEAGVREKAGVCVFFPPPRFFFISPPPISFFLPLFSVFLSSLSNSFQVLSGLTEDEMMVFDGKCDGEREGETTEGVSGGGGEKERDSHSFLLLLTFLLLLLLKQKNAETAFEGEEYYKHNVTATLLPRDGDETEGGGEAGEEQQQETFVYCWAEKNRAQLLPEDWDYSRFREEHLSGYVEMCAGFEEELREEARAASAAARSSGDGGE